MSFTFATVVITLGSCALLVRAQPPAADAEKKTRDLSLDADVSFSAGFASASGSFSSFGSSGARAGSVNEWCSLAFSIPCRSSGTECKGGQAVADLVNSPANAGSGHTEFCVCKNGYEKYISPTYDNRCRPVMSAIPDPTNAECEFQEDCDVYQGKTAGSSTCRIDANRLIGRCTCGSDYVYDRSVPGCRSYDCVKDGDAKCKQDRGPNAMCKVTPGSPAQCGCRDGFMMLHDPVVGRPQCRDLLTYKCDSTNVCPAATGTACSASGRCECPKNQVLMPVVGSPGQLSCRVLGIGNVGCMGDADCPERAICQKGSAGPAGMCLCRDYHKTVNNGCQLALGMCCRTSSDCGELRNATALPLNCIRATNSQSRGVCLCQGVGNNAWNNDRCQAASC